MQEKLRLKTQTITQTQTQTLFFFFFKFLTLNMNSIVIITSINQTFTLCCSATTYKISAVKLWCIVYVTRIMHNKTQTLIESSVFLPPRLQTLIFVSSHTFLIYLVSLYSCSLFSIFYALHLCSASDRQKHPWNVLGLHSLFSKISPPPCPKRSTNTPHTAVTTREHSRVTDSTQKWEPYILHSV